MSTPRTRPDPPTYAQAAGRWGDGIRVVVVGAFLLWALVWPLGVWHGTSRDGTFTWDSTSLIAEGCWLGFLTLLGVLAAVIRVMQR